MRSDSDAGYGLPIISIYILGHLLGDLKEPIVYVRRYLDYDDQVIEQSDPFIESLTHDSIIVQIPSLQGRTRNHLERLLNVFDQDYCTRDDDHLLEIDEDIFTATEFPIINRLFKAIVTPDVRRSMELEDQILSEIENRDTIIMCKEREIEQNKQVIEQKDRMLQHMVSMLSEAGISMEEIAQRLSLSPQEVKDLSE